MKTKRTRTKRKRTAPTNRPVVREPDED